jgi:HK97 gp10 family phage protein
MAVVDWHPESFMGDLDKTLQRKLEKAGRIVAAESKRLIGAPKAGTPPPHRVMRVRSINGQDKADWVFKQRKAKDTRAGWQYDWVVPRSRPGDAPAWQTGTLGRSVFHQLTDRKTVIVGVPALRSKSKGADPKYGLYLEVGTSKMAPRPYLRPALANKRREIQEIFKTK